MNPAAPSAFVIGTFLAILAGPPMAQLGLELARGTRPPVLEVFTRRPAVENLRAYERSLQEQSVVVRALRPVMQAVQFFALYDAGAKALRGRGGWLFYRPGVESMTQRSKPNESTAHDAVEAIAGFRDDLNRRGIHLLVVPVPNKESVYPDQLTGLASPPARVIGPQTRILLEECERRGVEVVDLFASFRDARLRSTNELYLRQDSHWSPEGMRCAITAVAERLLEQRWLEEGAASYTQRPAPVERLGDLVRMLKAPAIERRVAPERIACVQVVRQGGQAYAEDAASEVLVMGDSFLRVFEQDEPGVAGFVAHLALALGRPLASIVNDGGASTLVRQELFRRPQLLENKKVVVWEFVERDLRLGVEGWQPVPLPPPPGVPAVSAPEILN